MGAAGLDGRPALLLTLVDAVAVPRAVPRRGEAAVHVRTKPSGAVAVQAGACGHHGRPPLRLGVPY